MKNLNKKIGIIGGVGPQSTNYIYKKIIFLAQKKYGAKNNDDYPEMIIHSVPIPDFISNKKKVNYALQMLKDSVKLLTHAGVSALTIGSNTVHVLLDELRKVTDVKFISTIELVAKKCAKRNYKTVALLGSPILIKSCIYEKELNKYKIKTLIPNEQEIAVLDHMIRSVIAGKKEHEKRKEYVQLINRLYDEGAEAIILGCTELPMAINYEALGDKMLNSDEILAEGIVDYYYEK